MYAGECMLDYRQGADSEEALVGAMLEADHYTLVHRYLTTPPTSKPGAGKRPGKKAR
jgi:hypothetical protein